MGVNNNISITQLAPNLQEKLEKYASNVTDEVKKLAKETAEELKKDTVREAPVLTGEYKKHISIKKTFETATGVIYTWYVKSPEYRLTHLLTNGHNTPKGKKAKKYRYLSKNVPIAEEKFVKGVEEILKNGH